MKVHPYIEISATAENMDWIRVTAEAVLDDSAAAKETMFEQNPNLHNIYVDKEDLF